MKRKYAIFSKNSGLLVGSLSWKLVKDIYGPDPDLVRAVYKLRRNGRLQIRWICTGLDANARENVEELDRLNDVRAANGLSPIHL